MSSTPPPFSLYVMNKRSIFPVTQDDVTCEHDDFRKGCASIVSFHQRVEAQDTHPDTPFEPELFQNIWTQHFENGDRLAYKYVFNNQIAGFVTFGPVSSSDFPLTKEKCEGKWGRLYDLRVTKEYHRKGFGSDLFNYALNEMMSKKPWSWLFVELPQQNDTIGFFRSRGVNLLHFPDQPNLKIGVMNLKEIRQMQLL